MSKLRAFLTENKDISNKEVEIFVSTRFKDEKGKPIPFQVKPLSSSEMGEIQKKSSTISKKGEQTFDSGKFNLLVAVNQCVDPDFRDVAWMKEVGVNTPTDLVESVLLAGEIAEISSKVMEISGFNQDINEEVEAAKK